MSKSSVAINIAPILTLAVIGLAVAKLAGWVTITWWIVFAPWLIPISAILAFSGACFAVAGILGLVSYVLRKK